MNSHGFILPNTDTSSTAFDFLVIFCSFCVYSLVPGVWHQCGLIPLSGRMDIIEMRVKNRRKIIISLFLKTYYLILVFAPLLLHGSCHTVPESDTNVVNALPGF